MATVETIDFDQVFNDIVERLKTDETRRLAKPLVRLWDGDWNFRGEVYNEIEASFQVINNETGKGTIVLPATYYLSRWMTDVDARAGHKNIFITVDYQGTRWSGALDELRQEKDETGYRTVTATFLHDYEHLKHIIAYSNPFLPPEIQFPRLWIMFGPAKWALKLTLLVNLMRLENNMWTLPDDPLKPDNPSWSDLTMSQWSQAVTPLTFEDDHSVFAIVHSRFKNMHDASKKIVADAQLTWEPRRYLDGDPPPWPGANLRHGCLVWDLVDHSGWDGETSFGGNIFTGLIRAFTTIGSDGMTEGIDVINDPTFPAEYSQPGYLGTIPRAPGIILRDGKRTGVQTNSFKYQPASDVGVVTGGHSMPGVNELISASIQMAGDLIAAMVGIPPVGGAADAILKPLYTDCVSGDTVIHGPDGDHRIDELAKHGNMFRVWALTPNGEKIPAVALIAFKKGQADLFEYKLTCGRSIKATAEHRFLTRTGWLRGAEIRPGSEIATVSDADPISSDSYVPKTVPYDEDYDGIQDGNAVAFSRVAEVVALGESDFYDMHVPIWENYAANGVWNHNTILAFMKWKDIGRAQDLGWSHFHETWGEGADRAYTLAALIALRTGMWRTRERTSHTVTVADGCEGLRIGQNGRGNCWLGTRIGTTVKDWGKPGRVYVDRVSELVLSYSRKNSPAFTITIGQRPDEDPILKGLEMIQEMFSIAQELGVL